MQIKNTNYKMVINTYQSTIESNKQNKQTAEQKQNCRYRERFDGAKWDWGWGNVLKGEGIKKYKLVVT